MVWRNKHRAGRRKRERIAALWKGPTITSVETGQYTSEQTRQHLRRSAWRARYANRPVDNNVETIDLTQDTEETSIPENINRNEFLLDETRNSEITESLQTIYTTTITKLFTKIERYLLTIQYTRENQIDN